MRENRKYKGFEIVKEIIPQTSSKGRFVKLTLFIPVKNGMTYNSLAQYSLKETKFEIDNFLSGLYPNIPENK